MSFLKGLRFRFMNYGFFAFDCLLSKNYGFEICFLSKARGFSNGIDFIDFKSALEYYDGDHCPRFDFHLTLFNFSIVEMSIYNINHKSPLVYTSDLFD